MPISITGLFTPSGGADAFDLLTWHDCDNHNWAATAAPGIDNDINDYAVVAGGYVVGSLWLDTTADKAYICLDNTNHAAVWTEITAGGGTGAPVAAHYLVGEAHADLTEEIVVGATPGGELGGTWASPTVDATHSGSAHADYVPNSLFDAQSILAATADNTPAAVTVAEQRLVGRLTGGNIDDIVIGIADDNIVQMDQSPYADDNDYAKFTANGLEGRSYAEVLGDIGAEPAGTGHTEAAAHVSAHAGEADPHAGYVLESAFNAKGDILSASANDTPLILTVGADDTMLMADAAAATGLKWVASAAGGNIDGVQAAAVGTADTFARSDHAHRIQHAIVDNAIVTVDGSPNDNEFGYWTASGMEGLTVAEVKTALAQTSMFLAYFDPTSASTTVSKATIGPLPFAGTFVKATLKCVDGETNGATAQLVDIHKQTAANEDTDTATTIFTTQGNRPTITNTHKAGNTTTFDVTTFAKGDYLYILSDVLGTGLTGLYVGIEVTQS